MWDIDRLSLTLPAGFEHRAARIARRLADELADLPVPAGARGLIESLAVPPVEIGPAAEDSEIAGRIARAIAAHPAISARTP